MHTRDESVTLTLVFIFYFFFSLSRTMVLKVREAAVMQSEPNHCAMFAGLWEHNGAQWWPHWELHLLLRDSFLFASHCRFCRVTFLQLLARSKGQSTRLYRETLPGDTNKCNSLNFAKRINWYTPAKGWLIVRPDPRSSASHKPALEGDQKEAHPSWCICWTRIIVRHCICNGHADTPSAS